MTTMTPAQTIFKWYAMNPFERDEARAQIARALIEDQVVVLPSETRYALVARADSVFALSQLVKIKGRSANQPLSIFLPARHTIAMVAHETPLSILLAEIFLPGPMTLVLSPKLDFPGPVILNDTIGIRVSSDPVLKGIFQKLEFPLTATSANRSGGVECTTVEEIIAQLGNAPLMLIDDGPRAGTTSTVLDARGDEAIVLREGAVSRSEIEAVTQVKKVKK